MSDYKNRDLTQGALFHNNRKTSPNQPDFRGELTISKALLRELVEKAKAGEEAKLSLSVWKKNSKAGNEFMSVAGQIYVDFKKEVKFQDDSDIPF